MNPLQSRSPVTRHSIGLFGGTFDPIHLGHIQIALELKQALHLDEMRLLPCHIPPHRRAPVASAEHRAAMVQLALSDCKQLRIDTLELHNPEPSYSVHTLEQLRQTLGDEVSLCLAMGMDSLVTLNSWYRWQALLALAHIIVAARPGWSLANNGEMLEYVNQHRGSMADLHQLRRGKIVIQELSLVPISSTGVRARLNQGQSVKSLIPDAVQAYIRQHQLYQPATVTNSR